MAKKEKIYQIKVTLKYSKPPIWRRLQVSSNISLFDLHKIIQIAMGWTNSHLHIFSAGGEHYGLPREDVWMQVIDERKYQLEEIAPAEKSKFVYEYDFGDNWEHQIVVEKILPVEPGVNYPRCVKAKRACPPEDVGGMWGYMEFLEAMKNPKHEDHEGFVEWWGGPFDPEAVDLDAINRNLQNIDAVRW